MRSVAAALSRSPAFWFLTFGASAAFADTLVFEFDGDTLRVPLARMERVGITPEDNVSFCFARADGREFGRVTRERVGQQFRIVFNGDVLTEPVIQTAILGGCGMVTNPGDALIRAVRELER